MTERRIVRSQVSLTEVPGGPGRTFEGRVVPYMDKTYIGPDKRGFYEQVHPDAFQADLRSGSDVVALFNHNPDYVLGRTAAGTLELDSRDDGLYSRIHLPDTTWGRDTAESTRRGDIRGMSFGFEARSDDWSLVPGGHAQLRTLLDNHLIDVSPVTLPAYQNTTAAVRSAIGSEDLEAWIAQRAASGTTSGDDGGLGGGDELANQPNNSDGVGSKTCPNCGAVNDAGARFCDMCGNALGDDASGEAATFAADRAQIFVVRANLRGKLIGQKLS